MRPGTNLPSGVRKDSVPDEVANVWRPSEVSQVRIELAPVDAMKAIEYFKKSLKGDPSNTELQWLLNLAYMIEGTYPSQVPKEYLIPPSVFASIRS